MTKTLRGTAASVGKVAGPVHVIILEDDFHSFQKGEILVTKQTSPAWTPLFMAARGVVTEIGGSLSHAAIVAREYGIPAVVAVKKATKLLKNGQIVILDGSKGTIQIVEK